MSADIKSIDDVLSRCETALPILRTMLDHEGLAGVDIADQLLVDIKTLRAILATSRRLKQRCKNESK